MEITDKQLIDDYLNGNDAAFALLVQRQINPVYNFVYRLVRNTQDAEDITQETFVKMWKNLKRYNQDQNFKTWLFTIARNTAIDSLRKKKSFVFSDFEIADGKNPFLDTLADPAPLPDELAARAERQTLFGSALGKRSPAYQEVFTLHHDSDLTFDEISTRLGKSINTVKSQYRRALLTLRRLLT